SQPPTKKAAKARYYIPLEPGQKLTGKIKTVAKFGAFVDLNMAVDGLVHISELSRQRVENVSDVVNVGDEVTVWVKKVDRERGRISLTMVKPVERKFKDIAEGDVLEGEVTRIENFGVFVDIGLPREGLVHVSELSHEFVKSPEEVVSIGDTVQVKVLKVDRKKRQVNLSMKALVEPPASEVEEEIPAEEEDEEHYPEEEPMPTVMAIAFGKLNQAQRPAKKKRPKRRKRNKVMDEVIAKTLQVGEEKN
ncbi:MAG: S1 RNA-binding domain-containing protein, partial [Caldilineae bacterium]